MQEALGTVNNPVFAREAIDYAYNHGVAVIASAADEAAEHHNQPGALPHTIVVNAIEGPADLEGVPVTTQPPSYLQLDGCTNFGTRIDLSVPATSCSSEATGKSAGVAGLVYSAALNACGASLYGTARAARRKMPAAKDCTRVDGTLRDHARRGAPADGLGQHRRHDRQRLLDARLNSPSTGTAAADDGEGGQADDINTAQQPETACSVGMAAACTDPNLNTTFAADEKGGVVGPLPDTFRYPTRKGLDEIYGYGRMDAYKSVEAAAQGWIPPQADITSPEWFEQLDPGAVLDRRQRLRRTRAPATPAASKSRRARSPTTRRRRPAATSRPSPRPTATARPCTTAPSKACSRTSPRRRCKAMFPPGKPASFTGNENGGTAQTSNGRPNTLPYAFTIRVVVKTASGAPGPAMTGEDRRQAFLHRDQDMLKGFPIEMRGDGDASPRARRPRRQRHQPADRRQLRRHHPRLPVRPRHRQVDDLPGWPVHTDPLPLHTGEHAFTSGEVSTAHYGPVHRGAGGGRPVRRRAHRHRRRRHAGQRLRVGREGQTGSSTRPRTPTTRARRWRATPRGSTSASARASAPRAASSPRRCSPTSTREPATGWTSSPPARIATSTRGTPTARPVNGFPVLVEDPDKVASVDPQSNQSTFNANVPADQDKDEDQGKIVDTPAVAQPRRARTSRRAIIVGTNEEYSGRTRATKAKSTPAALTRPRWACSARAAC